MSTQELLDKAYHGSLSKLDMYNMIEDLTDGFEESKFRMLCDEFEFYVFMAQENWRSQFSDEQIQKAIDKFGEQGKELPVLANRRLYLNEPIFSKPKKKRQLNQSQIDGITKFVNEVTESKKKC